MSEHKIVVHGAVHPDRISGHLFRDLLDILVEGSERALRFRLEGRSTAKGTQPRWIRLAADFALLRRPDLDASAAMIEARPLLETMPDRFRVGDLFSDLDPRQSPIELFEDALEDAVRGNEDSDRFDAGLVKTFEKLESLFEQGVDRLEIVNGRTIHVDVRAMERVQLIAARSYAPQRVRVAGRLEAIRYSDCRFTLLLNDRSILQGTAIEVGHEVLQGLFGNIVVVTGAAVFRPSGAPLRIEAERIQPASENEIKLWSTTPKPLLGPLPTRTIREEQRSKRGLLALLGKWPGNESDEEIQEALESLS